MEMRGCPGRTSRRDEEGSFSVQEPSLVEGGLRDTKRSCWEPGSRQTRELVSSSANKVPSAKVNCRTLCWDMKR